MKRKKNLCADSPKRVEIAGDAIPKGTVGVYRLWNKVKGQYVLRYFGRSANIRSRIMRHSVNDDCSHFTFEETDDLEEAFRRECRDYHLEIPTTLNERHPGSADSGKTCPYCHTQFAFVQGRGINA